jgi:hypothetical protein
LSSLHPGQDCSGISLYLSKWDGMHWRCFRSFSS